jgi:hypothetical protein
MLLLMICKSPKYIAQKGEKMNFGLQDNNRGLYRIIYNDAYKTTKVENVSKRNKIENDFGVKNN